MRTATQTADAIRHELGNFARYQIRARAASYRGDEEEARGLQLLAFEAADYARAVIRQDLSQPADAPRLARGLDTLNTLAPDVDDDLGAARLVAQVLAAVTA